MKRFSRNTILAVCAMTLAVPSFAGNKDRSGQAGATELLVNPWAASTGVFGSNTAYVQGIEAMKTNVAGLAFTESTEVGASYGDYLNGAHIGILNVGIAQRLGNAGVIGLNIQSMSFGAIRVTDYNNPNGGIGTYNPAFYNISLGYAKEFSHAIHVGLDVTVVSEAITNVSASGVCFDAGVQYQTGKQDNFHFGVTLRNVGTNMSYSGAGFDVNAQAPDKPVDVNLQTPTEAFEMPTYLNIGVSYDFYLGHGEYMDDKTKSRLTVMGAFTSNSFNNDYFGVGLEYAYKETFMLRSGFRYEKDIFSTDNSTTFYSGYSFGATVKAPMGKKGPVLAFDYSYRPTVRPDNGVHTFSVRFMRRLAKKGAQATDQE